MQSQPSQAFKIIEGDVTEVLKTLPANFFDAVMSDPPYGISFMGMGWDRGVPSSSTYKELARVLKPGAFGLHFGGTRMWHRLAVNLEDAGFELRDTVMWLYGSGFPKSHNISKALNKAAGVAFKAVPAAGVGFMNNDKEDGYHSTVNQLIKTGESTPAAIQWDGYGTALKPAWEPALLVQKPLEKTYAKNALTHGCGGLNIDGCRVGTEPVAKLISASTEAKGSALFGGSILKTTKGCELGIAYGRFPANLILDELAGAALDEQSGTRPAGNFPTARGVSHIGFASGQATEGGARKMTDKGGASRFFYCAKVSSRERNAGLGNEFEEDQMYGDDGATFKGLSNTCNPSKNSHPTLKPIALTEYLAKLLLVPNRKPTRDIYGNEVKTPRRILVPFSGAGSEMIGCLKAGWDEVWGIEIDDEYVCIAKARIAHHCPTAAPLKELDKAA